MNDVRVAVVGAGLAGACTAWQLATRGVDVTLIDAYAPGHVHGSSHGNSRIFRRAYPDPFYVGLTGAARDQWQRLETDAGEQLLRITGGLDHGRMRNPARLSETLADCGVGAELLDENAAARRWPGMRFGGPALFHDEAGVVDPDATVAAAVRSAAERGARLRFGTRVTAIRTSSAGVQVCGADLSADVVVVAAGAWLPELDLGEIALPPLEIRQQQVFHFRMRDPGAQLPVFVHKEDGMQMYGLPSGRDVAYPAMKIGRFDDGLVTTASTRSGVVADRYRTPVIDYVRHWLPALDPEPVAEASCLFTMTPSEDFLLDRVDDIVIVSSCSGHGAKFAPLTGLLAAQIVLGERLPEPRFALSAHVHSQ